MSWYLVGAIAFFVGQFILHSLGVFVHEAAHNLIFKSKLGSRFALWLIVCGSLSFGESLTYMGVHAFPTVPWIYLPKIKVIAAEYFTNDNPYSYFKWWYWAKSVFAPLGYNRYIPESNSAEDRGLF